MNHAGRANGAVGPMAGARSEPARPLTGERDGDVAEALLRFLGRLSRFGLAAGMDPLLKPAKPGS